MKGEDDSRYDTMALFLPSWHPFAIHHGAGSRRAPSNQRSLEESACIARCLCLFSCCVMCWEQEHLKEFVTAARLLLPVPLTADTILIINSIVQ